MTKLRESWPNERLQQCASECSTYEEFAFKYPMGYERARRKGLLPKICKHMPEPTQVHFDFDKKINNNKPVSKRGRPRKDISKLTLNIK